MPAVPASVCVRLQFPACSTTAAAGGRLAECWDEERFSSEQEGLVVFDGGSYSLGPSVIGEPRCAACCPCRFGRTALLLASQHSFQHLAMAGSPFLLVWSVTAC